MGKKIIVGDIWDQKGYKVVSTNLGGVHGRGLAAQARFKGFITSANKSFATSPLFTPAGAESNEVITLAVKGKAPETAKIKGKAFSEKTTGGNVKLLKSEVGQLINFARKNPSKNINLPFIGLGFGEGNESEILPILQEAAKEPNIYLVTKDQKTVEKYKDTFKAGVRSDRSLKTLNNAIKSKISNQTSKIPKDARTIYFQGPSKGITDPQAFKRALTKRYQEERRTWGGKQPIHVLYGGRDWNQADQLISEWASEGFKKYLPAKRLHKDFKTNKLGYKKYGDMKFQVWDTGLYHENKPGTPIIAKEPINISKLDSPDKSIEKISFSRQGKIVYPGKDTEVHFERFDQLLEQKGNKLKPAFEAFLDEIEDIGKGTTKQKPDIPELRKAKVGGGTKLPMLDRGQGSVTKQAPDIKSMLAGIQVAEEKARYYNLDDFTLDRIKSIQKGIAYPLEAGESVQTADADSPEIEFIDNKLESYSQDQGSLGEYKGRGPKNLDSTKAIVSETDELKAETYDYDEDDEKVTIMSTKTDEDLSQEDAGLRKELTQLKRFKNIIMPSRSGGKAKKAGVEGKSLKQQRKEQRQRVLNKGQGIRILTNIIKDRFATESTLGVKSTKNVDKKKSQITKVISGPHKKGILIKADPKLISHPDPDISARAAARVSLEKQYIKHKVTRGPDDPPRNPVRKDYEVQIRSELNEEQKQAKIDKKLQKISKLEDSSKRVLAKISSYRATNQLSPSSKPSLSTTTHHNFLNWLRSTQEAKKKHAEAIRGNIYKRVKDKKVTTAITKVKNVTPAQTAKGEAEKIDVKKQKSLIKVDKQATSKIVTKLQDTFHSKDKKPRYKSTVGKGLKFTRGLGAFTLFSSVTGVLRARKELKDSGVKDPSFLETMSQMYIPKSNFQINQYKERKKLARAI